MSDFIYEVKVLVVATELYSGRTVHAIYRLEIVLESTLLLLANLRNIRLEDRHSIEAGKNEVISSYAETKLHLRYKR